MSDSIPFWAANIDGVKIATTPAYGGEKRSVSPKALTRKATTGTQGSLPAAPQQTHISVFACIARDIQKINWADSDNEENFLASFTSTTQISKHRKTSAAEQTGIAGLIISAREKDARVGELERSLVGQQRRIVELENSAKASASHKESSKQNRQQELPPVKGLVTEVDETTKRFPALKTKVKKERVLISEVDVNDHSTQVSTSKNSKTPQSPLPQTEAVTESLLPSGKTAPSLPESSGFNNMAATSTTAKPNLGPKEVLPKQAGPAVNLSDLPVLASLTTIKQTKPPPQLPS